MPMRRTTAKKLVSDTEFKLINESFPPLVSSLSDKALLQRMDRARKARDRYHTMVEKQRTKTPTGTQRAGAAPANLKDVLSKEKIFDETLARFERQTAKTGNSAGPQGAAPAKSAAKPTAKAVTSGKGKAGTSTKRATRTTQTSTGATKAVSAKTIAATGGGVNTPAKAAMGKKSGSAKSGSQGTSKASVKMANKAAAKSGAKATKTAKGKGGATKNTPRGRHGALAPATTLR